ncbi:MAG TPA: glycosyltransferase [Candidatus Margulisiibacteriota bacterium]|nr:glycosyltransferase [Candidatus Margulisiibacteriota bacterium]
MKILQVIPSLARGFGGPTEAILDLSFNLAKSGEEVTIFTTNADVKGVLRVPLGVPVELQKVRIFYFPIQYLKHYKFSLGLAKALQNAVPGFDIVHIHSLFQFSTLAASYYCRKYNKPYIIRPLGQLDPYLLKRNSLLKNLYISLFERRNLEGSSAVHFTTEAERLFSRKAGLEFKDFVLGIGIDITKFQGFSGSAYLRARYPYLKNSKIILFLSRINFKKGLDILIEAFARLSRVRQDVHLVIAGPDNEGYGEKVRRWIKEEGIDSRVTFTGMLEGDDKLSALKESDIFVLPSYSENFGIAAVEAMASGLPAIISDKVGISGEVRDELAGIVIDPSALSLYEAMESLFRDPNLKQEIALKGKKMAEEHYAAEKIARRMIERYNEIARIRR